MSEWKWYHKPVSYRRDGDTPEVSYRRLTAATFLILGIVCILGAIVLGLQWSFNKSVPVKQEYTNYIYAAAGLNDPVLIIQTLEQALQGIGDLGLNSTDSGAAWSWDVNYHHSVQFVMDEINATIEYANTLIEWQEQSYTGTVVENVNDVYNEKLVHLKDIANDPSTSLIEDAYCFNNKPELFWYVYPFYIFVLGFVIAVAGLMILFTE